MKILIYGAGVVGCTYGWQLSEAGYDITMLVRKGKREVYDKNGIHIRCNDFRSGKKQLIEKMFRPHVIEDLTPDNDYEYIIVATNNFHLKDILPILKKGAGKSHILFFMNIWDSFEDIASHLSVGQYFFGFPFMTGGGKDKNMINSVISGLKYSYTPLGEMDGSVTPRVRKISDAFEKASMKPFISKDIITWLITHYSVAAGLSGGVMKAGNAKEFAGNTHILCSTIKSIREGLRICKSRGLNPRKEKSNRLYYLPLFISIPIAKKIYNSESLELMFDRHINHSPEEIHKMIRDVIDYGKKYNVTTYYLEKINCS